MSAARRGALRRRDSDGEIAGIVAVDMRAADDPLSAWFLADDPRAVLRAVAAAEDASHGRVRRPETSNLRTGRPERGGLFCARVFGPLEDHRCVCGELGGEALAGQVCARCGVLCGERRVRGERWGHIESPVPLFHPRLLARVAGALGCTVGDLRAVIRCEADLLADGRVAPIRHEEELRARGPWYVADRLGELASELVISQVPVTPADWRGTRGDPQDRGYRSLINRCARLHRLIELNAPEVIIDNEARLVQEAFEGVYAAVRAELAAHGPVVVASGTPRAAELLREIYADPDDDGPRRGYAAHLRAAGDLRGEFIALQLAGRTRPSRREADLLRRNFDRWLAPFDASMVTEVEFRRGFLGACKVPSTCVDPRPAEPAWSTVEHLDSDDLELVTSPVMRGLRSLALRWSTLRALCERDEPLPRVDALLVRLSRVSPARSEVVTGSDVLPGLRALTLVRRASDGEQDWSWLAGTPLAGRLERLSLQLAVEQVESLAMPWWIGLMQRHPGLGHLEICLGARRVVISVRRDGEWLALQVLVSRAVVEQIMMTSTELGPQLGRCLTEIDPYGITALRVDSPCGWFGEELEALALALRGRFGAAVKLPTLA